jgi:hypothetical protein
MVVPSRPAARTQADTPLRPTRTKVEGRPGRDAEPIELYCPFEPGLNARVAEAQRGSVAWAERYGMVQSSEHLAKLDRSKIAWLTARGFPSASLDVLQLAADWTTLFCLLDDRIETREADPVSLSTYFLDLIDAFRGGTPGRSLDPIGEGLIDLSKRMDRLATPAHNRRFAAVFRELLGGFLWEEINRWKLMRPNRDAYRTMRQITVGLRPQFILGEIGDGIDLPAHVRGHRSIAKLESITCSAIGWANDIFTCAKELGQDHAHNIVLLVMDEESLSLTAVVRQIAAGHDELIRSFQTIEEELPSSLAEDESVQLYIRMLRHWIRGHLDWARETGRYGALSRSQLTGS